MRGMSNAAIRWAGRVALVTGASSGIGRAVALALLERGMNVAACARRRERLDALAAAAGDRLLAVETDLRDEGQILALFEQIHARWGGVAVLVNNAGLGHDADLAGASVDGAGRARPLDIGPLRG
jgi:NADP-dependent 3-hydroxy acid dehydrogenase YdfG